MTEKDRLARLERAVAQLAAGLRQCSAWWPRAQGAPELAELVEEQLERRPHAISEVR